jgi:type II secretory pathway pseudopilin PulG
MPADVMNVTVVPLWTGVPAGSTTVAMSSAVPLSPSVVESMDSVTIESVGASKGTLSHAAAMTMTKNEPSQSVERDTGGTAKYSSRMRLGQGERGYAMAALLVGLSVMAVLMGMALPAWSHLAKREREEELIWRGQQYARAIGLFQRKYANTFPPTVDILVEQKFLRRKYKDPVTNDDFQPIPVAVAGPNQPRVPGNPGTNLPGQQPQAPQPPTTPGGFTGPSPSGRGQGPNSAALGIQGVVSKSSETSIKLYNGRNKYNEWAFVYLETSSRLGPGTQQPGKQPGKQSPGPTKPFGRPQ